MSSSVPSTQSLYRVQPGKGIDALQLDKQAPVPSPQRGQLLIRVRAVSLNYRDLLIAKGGYVANLKDNVIPCSDGAGEVAALGADVADFAVGDRVSINFTPSYVAGNPRYQRGLAGSLGGDLDGTLAQYVVAEATGVLRIPDSLSFEQAATLPCAGVTAYNSLYHGPTPLRAGATVLVQGTGGVSILAAQLAHAAGARVLVTSSSDAKLQRVVQELGVDKADTINYKTTPKWGDKAKELTGGLGVDHIVEVGGVNTFGQSLACIRAGGEISVVGFVGGAQGAGVNPLSILTSGASVRGILVGSREMFLRLLEHIQANNIKPVVDRVFPLEEAAAAYRYLESGAHFGKVVIAL